MHQQNNYQKLRMTFKNFFVKKQHIILPPSGLLHKNDPSIFFTNAGMNQFKKYFTLEEISPYKRAVTIQPCIRAGGKHNDLDNVGFTARHHTFFEMMGNFSFYDYFREEALNYAIDFLTKELCIPEKKLFFSIHMDDHETYNLLKKMTAQPIIKLGTKDNFWSMGDLGPCGYCGEIYYYIGHEENPTEDDFRKSFQDENPIFLEIWNIVFMEFNQMINGRILLEKKSVDTGMGLERILSILEGTMHNYKTSIITPLVHAAQHLFQIPQEKVNIAYIAADHIKTTVFLLHEGLTIGNEGASYVLRKIIRRALTYLNLKEPGFYKLAPYVQKIYQGTYLFEDMKQISDKILQEEMLFFHTISNGFKLLENSYNNNEINEDFVFKLYETYGLPLDFSTVFLKQKGINLNYDKIDQLMDEHKKASGQMINFNFDFPTISTAYETLTDESKVVCLIVDGNIVNEVKEKEGTFLCVVAKTPFYARGGGQEGDQGHIYSKDLEIEVFNTTKKNNTIIHHCKLIKGIIQHNQDVTLTVNGEWRNGTTIHHTATHLLHALLQHLVDKNIQQKGSLITNNRLRFDFNLSRPLTVAEKKNIELYAQKIIQNDSKVNIDYMPYDVAIQKGAEFLEGMSYEDQVRVVTMHNQDLLSMVLCGGTHVKSTNQIKSFKILSEKGHGNNIRRIEVQCA